METYKKRTDIIKPYLVDTNTQYFRKKWRPILGPVTSELIRELRQQAHDSNENTFVINRDDLSHSLGISRDDVDHILEHDGKQFKIPYLDRFIQMETEGNVVKFIVYLDEPLTPDDEEKLRNKIS